LNPHRLFAH